MGCLGEHQQTGLLRATLIRAKKVRFSVGAIFPLLPSIFPLCPSPKSYTFGSRRITSTVIFPRTDIASLRIPTPGLTSFLKATSAKAAVVRYFATTFGRSAIRDRLFERPNVS